MGQKIHPFGFRLGISKDWRSRWFADKRRYPDMLIEDHKIRNFLKEKLEIAGLKTIEIERSVNEVKILVKVSKPGIVIGRAGSGIEALEKELRSYTNDKLKITVEEIKTPEIEAALVAQYICRQIKRRIPARRVANSAIRTAVDKGVEGIKIQVKGLLSGSNTIARTENYKHGPVPLQTLRADIDYAQVDCKLLYGTVGIKVWIYNGEEEI
jgi:small subunit ribosomal protein S3